MAATAANSVTHPTLIEVDPFMLAREQKGLHNRWHPDIPPVVTVKPGEVFNIECVDWTGAQIGNNDCSDDIKNVDLSCIHNLSGPVAVEGAEPGDCLVVDILDVRPFDKMPWGYTGIFELENGGGLFAREFQSRAAKAIWDFEGVYATSRHIPGVRFAGVSHPGLIGTAPSHELLATWNKREGALIEAHANAVPPVAYDGDGKQYNMDATVAYKQAALNAIAYLQKIGYTREQAYLLLSAAPIESHVGAVVDSPNACVTLALPLGIFEHDILPKEEGLTKLNFGQCAIRSDGVL
ncbi:formamidase [Paxillus involutus ATCC 200175]|nr:formamidase [Paxillus involutus ATCC 200175]